MRKQKHAKKQLVPNHELTEARQAWALAWPSHCVPCCSAPQLGYWLGWLGWPFPLMNVSESQEPRRQKCCFWVYLAETLQNLQTRSQRTRVASRGFEDKQTWIDFQLRHWLSSSGQVSYLPEAWFPVYKPGIIWRLTSRVAVKLIKTQHITH